MALEKKLLVIMQGELFFQGHSRMIYPSEKSLVVFFPRSWVIILLIQETNTKVALWWRELALQRFVAQGPQLAPSVT